MINEPQLYGPQSRQWEREMLAMQPTEAQRVVVFTSPLASDTPSTGLKARLATFLNKKGRTTRVVVVILILIAIITVYFTWFSSAQNTSTATDVQTTTTQNFSATATSSKTTYTSTSATTTSNSGTIQVYIVGAVKRPGVYTLEANARVYQVLKDAGGPLTNANLVSVNLAAPLKDGEEIYIPRVGEQMPANVDGSNGSTGTTTGSSSSQVASGALVNINTASADEMRQQLHVAAKTAQAIINYRLQHGNFTSVDQLANAVSKTIYDRIKGMVTV